MNATTPLVSVVVPTRNSAATLHDCLASIAAQTYPSVELLVVDRDSDDETKQIARAQGARVFNAGPERSAQRNLGAARAHGRFVMFIDSDMVLEPSVVQACADAARDRSAIIVPERGFDDSFLARVRALEKRCYEGNDDVEAARFFDRAAFLDLGGYDERLVAGEDWDLTDRWRATGGTVARVRAAIIHDDRHLRLRDLVKKRFFYGRRFVAFSRKHGGASTARHLSPTRFLRPLPLLARSPVTAAGMLAIKAVEAISFALGMLAGTRSRGHAH